MVLYFEFEDRRVMADVQWADDEAPIAVHLTDPQLKRELPTDLLFEIGTGRKVVFTIESPDNERLVELQSIISRRLQEFVNKE